MIENRNPIYYNCRRGVIAVKELNSWKTKTNCSEEYNTIFHIHECCELLYVINGEILTKVTQESYVVGPEQLLITCRLEGHSIEPITFPYERIVIHIDSALVQKTGVSPFLFSVLEHHPEGWNHLFDLNKNPEIGELMEKLHSEINSNDSVSLEMSETLLYQLLLLLYRNFPESFTNTAKDSQMEDAKRYIEEQLADFNSVQNLSKMYYMTTSHFIVRFKKHVGCTPHKYYNICRIAKARYLLSSGDQTLAEIAEQSGFSDVNSFVRSFRTIMGITPGKFRERVANEHKKSVRKA